MKQKGIFICLLSLCFGIVASKTPLLGQAVSVDGAVVPGSLDNEIHIRIENYTQEAVEGLEARVAEVPPSILNLELTPNRIEKIEPDQSQEFIVQFDVSGSAPMGDLDPIKFDLSLEKGDLKAEAAHLNLVVTEIPVFQICALRADAPRDFPSENAIDFCNLEAVPVTEYDRVAVFFTPGRDLRQPVTEKRSFTWVIRNPHGRRVISGDYWDRGTDEAPEVTFPFAKEGSPGRFAVVMDLWERRDKTDPDLASRGPGTYTIQTADVKLEGNGLFGQGETDAFVDGEWQDEATFEIASSRLYFQGFVAEPVKDDPLPEHSEIWEGQISVGNPQINGSTVVLESSAWWKGVRTNEQGERVSDEEVKRAKSRLTLEFSDQFAPGHEEMGEVKARLEPVEKGKFFFTAGMHLMIPISPGPPKRSLVEGENLPGAWSSWGSLPNATWMTNYSIAWERRFRTEEQETAGSNVWWIWPRNVTYGYGSGNEAVQITDRTILFSGWKDETAGEPDRGLIAHLHDPETLWVIPVFMTLTDNASLDRSLEVRSYGYAIYGARPGTYDGPPPGVGGDDTPVLTEGEEDPEVGDDDGEDQAAGPIDPNSINPGEPRVAGHIQTWLSVAVPPKNVTEGANFHYDQRGNLVGTTAAGDIMEARHEENLPFDPNLVWERRERLDSVDHCTIEEYVVARLGDEATDDCRGRYAAPTSVALTNFSGQPAAQAKRSLESDGFVVSLVIGREASSRREALTVYEQKPGAGAAVDPGGEVELTIFGDFDPQIAVPELLFLSASEARSRLEEAGLEASITIGEEETVHEDLAYQVYQQTPGPSIEVAPGSEVQLTIYGPYNPLIDLPDVSRLSPEEAESRLTALGLRVRRQDAGLPDSREMGNRVGWQRPQAEAQVEAESEITIGIHSEYVDPRCEGVMAQAASLRNSGQNAQALDLYVEAQRLECPDPALGNTIADLSSQIRQEEEKQRRCNDLISRGNQANNTGRSRDSLNLYRQAQDSGCQAQNLDRAIANLEDAIRQEEQRQRQCNDLLNRGDQAHNSGRYSQALDLYRQAQNQGCQAPNLNRSIANTENAIRQQQQQQQEQQQRCNDLIRQGNEAKNRQQRERALDLYSQARQEGCSASGLDRAIAELQREMEQESQCRMTLIGLQQALRTGDRFQQQIWTQQARLEGCTGPEVKAILERIANQGQGNGNQNNDRDSSPTRWVLVKTVINPDNGPLEWVNPGARFRGSFERWRMTPTSLSWRTSSVDYGHRYYDVTLVAKLTSPPRELVPGSTINLRTTFSSSGNVAEHQNPGIQFDMRADGFSFKGNKSFKFYPYNPRSGGKNSLTTGLVVPKATRGGEISFRAFLWNCGVCNVRWVYEAR